MSQTQQKHVGLGIMKKFVIFSIIYFEFAIATTLMVREDPDTSIIALAATLQRVVPKFLYVLLALAVAGVVMTMLSRIWCFRSTLSVLMLGLIGCVLFQTGFTLVKSNLPEVIPFYADPMLADWDRALHGGYDPWTLTDKFSAWLPEQLTMILYMKFWGPMAVFLPVALCIFDNDAERVKRTLFLYVIAWVLIGNVFALIGMSGGPVYYDRIVGGDRFADLTAALVNNGLAEGSIGKIQNALWLFYTGDYVFIGSGISSFPSVHVAVAAVFAFYLAERSRGLAIAGFTYLAIVLFLSVYTGYHYALDGYFSIAVVGGLWTYFRRRATTEPSLLMGQPV
jgi:hypothetical protein